MLGSKGGTVVKALASHQCSPGSNPGVDAICGLILLLVLSLAPKGFSPGTPVFPSPQKPTFPNSNSTRNQVDEEPLCGCATCKSLFIYLFLFMYSFSLSKAPSFQTAVIRIQHFLFLHWQPRYKLYFCKLYSSISLSHYGSILLFSILTDKLCSESCHLMRILEFLAFFCPVIWKSNRNMLSIRR